MKEKDRPTTGVETGVSEDAPAPGRVYDIDADPTGPVEGEVPAGPEADAPGDEAPAEPADAPAGKHPRGRLKFSRKQILDRFAEKNSAIARLAKEKAALEKRAHGLQSERDALSGEKGALEAQVRDFKDKWLRTAADFENHRKRTAKEWELLKQQSKTEVILEVLNSLDDFERAFAVVEENGESEFVKGIRLIYNNLLQVLQKLGVTETDALHQPFDPTRHMAVGQTETTDVASGHVAKVVQKGYLLNGSVIRPAHVIVAK